MVIGVIPVAVTVAGNCAHARPSGGGGSRYRSPWSLLGLALVSALEISGVHAYLAAPAAEKAAGLIAAGGAVVLWTWYALANARFLAGHHDMAPRQLVHDRGRRHRSGGAGRPARSPRSPASSPPPPPGTRERES